MIQSQQNPSLRLAELARATNSCSTGTFAPVAAATGISISGATIPVNTTCTFSVKVKGTIVGPLVNTTGNVTSVNGGNGNIDG